MDKQVPKPTPETEEWLRQVGRPLTKEELKELNEMAVKLQLVAPDKL